MSTQTLFSTNGFPNHLGDGGSQEIEIPTMSPSEMQKPDSTEALPLTTQASLMPAEAAWPHLHVPHYLDPSKTHPYPMDVIDAGLDTGYAGDKGVHVGARLEIAMRFRVLVIKESSKQTGRARYHRHLVIVGGRLDGDYSVRLDPGAALGRYLKALPLDFDDESRGHVRLFGDAETLGEVLSYGVLDHSEDFPYPAKPGGKGFMPLVPVPSIFDGERLFLLPIDAFSLADYGPLQGPRGLLIKSSGSVESLLINVLHSEAISKEEADAAPVAEVVA